MIELSVVRDIRKAPIIQHGSRLDKSAGELRKQVIEQGRFGRRCYFCDFAFGTTDSFDIHNLDGDHTNNDLENLVPVCELCHTPFHLDTVSKKWPSDPGKIVFLPELTQVQLNNLLQVIFYCMAMQSAAVVVGPEQVGSSTGEAFNPHTVYRRITDRAHQVEMNPKGETVRKGLSDPLVCSRLLLDMSDEEYGQRGALLGGCRYVPGADYFIQQAGMWNGNGASFSRLDLAAWPGVAGVS
ncbi:HNH endonuclease signature motif containing protein [Pseudomonas aeruginosa]|uniref:HNH endonuclease signature motif containing protein n=1 Tax=Pseudomonas aeruginosa TaxID=287 RepID=UPI00053D8975|nr:HNH endonuclease signature motif containing protein [Pseudomonas aeruginosa]